MPGIKGSPNEQAGLFHVVYPNMFWFLLPNHMFVVIVEPVSENKSIEHSFLMVHENVDVEKYRDRIDKIHDFYDVVNKEDIKVCEEVTLGISGNDSYQKGIYVKPYEKTIQRFHDFIISDLVK